MSDELNIFDDDDITIDKPVEETSSAVKKPWTPDVKTTEGLEELNRESGVVVDKDKFQEKQDTELKNIVEDKAKDTGASTLDDLHVKTDAIEESKKRLHIKKLQILDPAEHAAIFSIASDTNIERRNELLDARISEYVRKFPDVVLEWEEGYSPTQEDVVEETVSEIVGETKKEEPEDTIEDSTIISVNNKPVIEKIRDDVIDKTTVRIDKENVNKIYWDKEDIEKIKKSRKVELDIVESVPLDYSEIENIDDNAVDALLSQYTRKMNDVSAPLPASRYRATFTGLSYPEILDLTQSQELNTIDGIRKKWTIAFNHIKNPSIGPFKSYRYYIDPNTRQKVHLNDGEPVPPGVNLEYGDAFDDFLKKTSFLDLDYMLWKILCATTMDKEVISINCHARNNGVECGKEYDWIYSGSELLDIEKVNPAVLEEMNRSAEASSVKDISDNYNESFLVSSSVITLPRSKFKVVFGHISAYDYINHIFGKVMEITESNSPSASEAVTVTMLSVVKSVLVPNGDKYARITSSDGIMKALQTLDEVDFQSVGEMMRIVLEPYQFTYSLRNITCPKCGNVSNIPIEDMSRMLFIVAQSLMSVQVVLKRT